MPQHSSVLYTSVAGTMALIVATTRSVAVSDHRKATTPDGSTGA
ncbi:hypothetical protein EDP1_3937 [Pseudomonas putida S610]|nr:hypothetical protein EDP1_3937 [Pseudomonas putida S610]